MDYNVGYIELVTQFFSDRQVSAPLVNNPVLYTDIRWDDGLDPIPQATLDGMMLTSYQKQTAIGINNFRTNWINGGFQYQGNLFDADPTSIANITGTMAYIAIGAPLPSNFTWRTDANTNIPFTGAQFGAFYAMCVGWINFIYNISWQHKANIEAFTSIDDIISYDYTVGWPRSDEELGAMMAALAGGTPLNNVMSNLVQTPVL